MSFQEIDFGLAEAEQEAADHPELLTRGYFDLHKVERLLSDRHFLLLGRKGAGKSAVFQHLRLIEGPSDLVTVVRMGSFPFNDFAGIESGGAADVGRYPSTWRLLLLLTLIESLRQDVDSSSRSAPSFEQAVERLQNAGLLSARDLRSLVLTVAKRGAGVSIGPFKGNRETTRSPNVGDLRMLDQSLWALVRDFFTNQRHVMCIDGLDDLSFRSDTRLRVLSALIEAVADMNTRFKQDGLPFKYLVACRSDMFSRLPGDNTSKAVQDRAVKLDWYQDTRRPERNHLIALVNAKAAVSTRPDVRVLPDALPRTLPLKDRRVDTLRYLLTYTRHTPRDLLRVLHYIQNLSRSEAPSEESVLSGISAYSRDYFHDAVLNEIEDGYRDDVLAVFELIREVDNHVFKLGQLLQAAETDEGLPPARIRNALRLLFDASGIGNYSNKQERYYTFKYRNERATLAVNQEIILHNALARALNVRMHAGNIERGVVVPRAPTGTTRSRANGTRDRRRTRGGQTPPP